MNVIIVTRNNIRYNIFLYKIGTRFWLGNGKTLKGISWFYAKYPSIMLVVCVALIICLYIYICIREYEKKKEILWIFFYYALRKNKNIFILYEYAIIEFNTRICLTVGLFSERYSGGEEAREIKRNSKNFPNFVSPSIGQKSSARLIIIIILPYIKIWILYRYNV